MYFWQQKIYYSPVKRRGDEMVDSKGTIQLTCGTQHSFWKDYVLFLSTQLKREVPSTRSCPLAHILAKEQEQTKFNDLRRGFTEDFQTIDCMHNT